MSYGGSNGTITINGGTVTDVGGMYGAGIGTGNGSTASGITINGGTVTANGGAFGAGIGGGSGSSDISITGGTITASSDAQSAIGTAPDFGQYIHITTDADDTQLYECTGMPSEDWTWQAVKIQPVSINTPHVTIDPISDSAVKGRRIPVSATVEINIVGLDEKYSEYQDTIVAGAQTCVDVTWSVEGSTADSKIQNGELYVDPQETAETLTLRVALAETGDSAVVPVIAPFAISQQPEARIEKVYGYESFSLSTAVEGNYAESAAFQWYSASEIDEATADSFAVPTGLDVGSYTYYCVVSDQEGDYAERSETAILYVLQKELEASIASESTPVTRDYDGTAAADPEDLGLSIKPDGVVRGDESAVTAAPKAYSYNSADVKTADTITAEDITLDGGKAGNYVLANDSAAIAGAILPIKLNVDEQSFTYNGKNTLEATLEDVNDEHVAVTLMPDSSDAGDYAYSAEAGAGKYTASLEDTNYIVASGGTLRIEQLAAKLVWSDEIFVYDASEKTVIAEVDNAVEGDDSICPIREIPAPMWVITPPKQRSRATRIIPSPARKMCLGRGRLLPPAGMCPK